MIKPTFTILNNVPYSVVLHHTIVIKHKPFGYSKILKHPLPFNQRFRRIDPSTYYNKECARHCVANPDSMIATLVYVLKLRFIKFV